MYDNLNKEIRIRKESALSFKVLWKKPIRTIVKREEECVLLTSVETADWSGGQIHTRAGSSQGIIVWHYIFLPISEGV